MEKRCEKCGVVMVKPKNLSIPRFEARKFCSRACSGKERKPDEKKCPGCGITFHRPPGMLAGTWLARTYCDPSCYHAQRTVTMVERTCEVCGNLFDVRPSELSTPGRGRTCSNRCRGILRGREMAGERHHNWSGGRRLTPQGYVQVWLDPSHPFHEAMGQKGANRVLEHRLVMAESLGRALADHETVHHINGDRSDNRIENLQLRQGKHGRGAKHVCLDCGSHNIGPAHL